MLVQRGPGGQVWWRTDDASRRGRDSGPDHRASPYEPGSAGQVIDDRAPSERGARRSFIIPWNGTEHRHAPQLSRGRRRVQLWIKIRRSGNVHATDGPPQTAAELMRRSELAIRAIAWPRSWVVARIRLQAHPKRACLSSTSYCSTSTARGPRESRPRTAFACGS